ncbi:MAG: 1-(5-phosphoribosyl)-5-[(5-phosphoribosylamino)methylideneamino]imidazole-4-carboxamide isomerase [Thermoleophilia bacterium]|nr:1-(5-phosphoribosyl)-5-[(5-phosphoribosylamino)methylideneamino]imidazole-4-carboxamide isomerase [Thermoleophilia bacterium]
MRLIPAIDIQGGRCVRLRKGDFADVTVFGDDPVAMAERWVSEGARYLHVVDLDGARVGEPRNFPLVRAIAEAVPVPVQTGGGIRTEEALELVAISPVTKAVLGTSAVEDEAFLERALEVLGVDRLVVAVDAEAGFVKTKGWQERSEMRALDLVARLEELGVREILFTDISRDGMMRNVNLEGVRKLAEQSNLAIIASGGVSTLEDLVALKSMEGLGVTGVIAGRALYEGRFSVAEALAVLDALQDD